MIESKVRQFLYGRNCLRKVNPHLVQGRLISSDGLRVGSRPYREMDGEVIVEQPGLC